MTNNIKDYAPRSNATPEADNPDEFSEIVHRQMGDEFVVGTSGSTLEEWDKPTEDNESGNTEHPFGDDFLRELGRASRIPDKRTPGTTTVTGTDKDGNVTEVETSSPD